MGTKEERNGLISEQRGTMQSAVVGRSFSLSTVVLQLKKLWIWQPHVVNTERQYLPVLPLGPWIPSSLTPAIPFSPLGPGAPNHKTQTSGSSLQPPHQALPRWWGEHAYKYFCPYLFLQDTHLFLSDQGCHFLLFLHCSQEDLEDLVILALLASVFLPKQEPASLHVHEWMSQISTRDLRRQDRKELLQGHKSLCAKTTQWNKWIGQCGGTMLGIAQRGISGSLQLHAILPCAFVHSYWRSIKTTSGWLYSQGDYTHSGSSAHKPG